jgi:hypothetical protein
MCSQRQREYQFARHKYFRELDGMTKCRLLGPVEKPLRSNCVLASLGRGH